MKKRDNYLNIILYTLVWMIIWWGIVLLRQDIFINKLIENHESKYAKFTAIDQLLESEFYDQESLKNAYNDMIEWALAWYVWGIDDPYTVYLKEEENTELTNELKDEAWFAWIWAVIEKQWTYALISEVIKNSPAAKAWLLPLDKIYMVEEQTLEDLTATEIVQLIRGEKGTEVNLFIERSWKDWQEDIKFWVPIIRDDVNIPSVSSELLQINWKNILYLEISIISSHTTSLLLNEFTEAVNELWAIDGIILDLRWNSGWYLEEAVKLLGHFFKKDTLLVRTKYRAYEDVNHLSEWRWELWKYPIVILVDQLTASAWEIIAIAFQENWTKIIWMQTFGKWSIQSVQDFTDWSSLKYTIGKRYSPNDVNIDEIWITPDIEVQRDYETYKENWVDNQLETAKKELMNEINSNL